VKVVVGCDRFREGNQSEWHSHCEKSGSMSLLIIIQFMMWPSARLWSKSEASESSPRYFLTSLEIVFFTIPAFTKYWSFS